MPRILTIGYGNRGYPRVRELLYAHAVTHVVDVRAVPHSKYWTDFGTDRLRGLLQRDGLRYIPMGDTIGAHLHEEGLAMTEPAVRDRFRLGIARLVEAAAAPERRICLLCGCMRPETCHRVHQIGPELESAGVEYVHLDADDELRSQAAVLARTRVQPALF
ncbi:MAG: DUF488 domain-containing protein [Fimbriimonadaceae bacterium]|nr:DUF488 domain-containing protein [Fimbriimonadaceae bacterium]